MAKHFLFALLFCLFAFPALAQEAKTTVTDPAEAELLLGRHLFAMDFLAAYWWPSYVNFGDIKIKKNGNLFSIYGNQTCYNRHWRNPDDIRGGKISLKGDVLTISSQAFTMKGNVQLHLEPYTSGNGKNPVNCSTSGTFHFSRKGHPKYWRMQNSGIICGPDKDYYTVDIFSAPLTKEPPNYNCADSVEKAKKMPYP